MHEIVFGTVTWLDLLAQAIGFVATGFMFLSYQQNTTKRIIGVQIISGTLFCVHFLLLGAYGGAVANVLGILRNIVFFNREHAWAKSPFWLYGFCAAFVVSGLLTWQNLFSVFPIIGMILGTLALYSVNPKITRRVSLGCSSNWLIYNAVNRSLAGALNEIIAICSILIAMYKFDSKKAR